MKTCYRSTLAVLFLGWMQAGAGQSTVAPEMARAVSLNIAVQPMAQAIQQFAQQTGLQVIYHADELAPELQSPALKGTFSPEDALRQLLANSGLQFRFLNARTVGIRPLNSNEGADLTNKAGGDGELRAKSAATEHWTARLTRANEAKGAAGDGPKVAEEDSELSRTAAESNIHEIIVTATKREERMQDVPISVTALEQKSLERKGVLDFEDLTQGIASLNVSSTGFNPGQSRGGAVPTIRGVAQLNPEGPTTAFYIDEVPLHSVFTGMMPDPNMFDVQRVEILRGPQGDLFGSSSMGGTIRVITNQPRIDTFEGRGVMNVAGVAGGGLDQEYNAMINVPLSQGRAALRIAASHARDAGYIDLVPNPALGTRKKDDVNDVTATSVRVALRWDATDNLMVTPSLFYQKISQDDSRQVSELLTGSGNNYRSLNLGIPESSDGEFYIANLLGTYDLGWGEITSSTSLYNNEVRWIWPFTGLIDLVVGQLDPTVDIVDDNEDQFTQELRFASKFDGKFNFVAGAFYREIERVTHEDIVAASFLPVFGTDVVYRDPNDVRKLDEFALFGQATYRLVEALEAGLGVRWFDYSQGRVAPAATGVFAIPARRQKATETGVTPTATLTWFATQDHTLYARIAEGFRPGFGFDTIFPASCGPELEELGLNPDSGVGQVDSDSLWNYEIGAKALLFDKRLRVNASAYRLDWSNAQVSAVLEDCGGFIIPSNAGEAQVRGFEVELEAQPHESVFLSLAVGYTDAELTKDAPGIGGSKGDALPQIAEWIVGASAEYSFRTMGLPAYVHVDYSFTKGSHYDFSFLTRRPDIALLGARVGLELKDWEIALFARNMTDERRIGICRFDAVERLLSPDRSTCVTKPRQIGISIGRSF